MELLTGDLHFWTLKSEYVKDDKYLCRFTYHDKKKSDESFPYYEEKKQYCMQLNKTWTPSNKRPNRLNDNLKHLEELFLSSYIVGTYELSKSKLVIVFRSEVFVFLNINVTNGDVESINIDKSMVGKFYSDKITDVLFAEKFLAVTYAAPRLTFIRFDKSTSKICDDPEEKLSSYFSNVSHFELYGPPSRRIERKLSLNVQQNTLLIWWQSTSNEVWPWTPSSTDRDRANVFVYTVSGPRISLLCCLRLEADPLIVTFSKNHPDKILTVEESPNFSENASKETLIRVYEINHSKLNRIQSMAAPVPGHMMKASWNNSEEKVAIICKNGFLAIFDINLMTTKIIKTETLLHTISWHKDGCLLCMCDQNGRYQIFDSAMNEVLINLTQEDFCPKSYIDLKNFFFNKVAVNSVLWLNGKDDSDQQFDGLFLLFNSGPMVYMRLVYNSLCGNSLNAAGIIKNYIRNKKISQAVNLLSCLNWNTSSDLCYMSVNQIISYLLRFPLKDEYEAYIETTLGTFYNLNHHINEEVVSLYCDSMGNLARRFFHHLMRYKKIEKAFLLAVDINSADLFMDIYHYGMDNGEIVLAESAKSKAIEIQQASTEFTSCDDDSESSDTSSEVDNIDFTSLRVSSNPTSNREQESKDNITFNNPLHRRHMPGQRPQPILNPQQLARGLAGSYPWSSDIPSEKDTLQDVHITIETPSQSESEEYTPIGNDSRVNRPANSQFLDFNYENDQEVSNNLQVIHFGII